LISISLDASGGDLPIEEKIKGALLSLHSDKELLVYLVGNESDINPIIKSFNSPYSSRIKIVHTSEIISMGDAPSRILKDKKNSSLSLATTLVKSKECQGIVSAGNTGAQMAAALFQLGRIRGIERPGIAITIPTEIGYSVLIDAGANPDVKTKNLLDFAKMGSIYCKTIYQIDFPSIALINNGTEEEKGNLLNKESFPVFSSEIKNFKGYIEGRDILKGIVDVIVCDGFTGNIILKTIEGTALSIFSELKKNIKTSFLQKVGASFLRNTFKALKNKMDYRAYGGAPLLGINGVSIICHGSSDSLAIKNAILLASKMVKNKTIETISQLS
jgi:glycerol-3-phosphate acyltransferase PlsX